MDYLLPCLFFVWVSFLWESYLSWRQRRVYKEAKKVPLELSEVISQETFDKSRVYQLDKSTFSLLHSLYKQVEFLVFIILGILPLVWSVSGDVLLYFGYSADSEVFRSIVFLWIFLVYSEITSLPWTIYNVFVLEEKHGFNKQTAGFFVKDQVKSFFLQLVLLSLVVAGLVFIVKWGGDYFYIYTWLFVLTISLLLIMTYHDFIAPCFDKYTPLPDGDLRVNIESLAAELKFPLKKLQIVEGSKRSAHSNAYFYGFGNNKCIVLFDTLLEDDLKPKKDESPSETKKGEETGKGKEDQQEGHDGTLDDDKEKQEGHGGTLDDDKDQQEGHDGTLDDDKEKQEDSTNEDSIPNTKVVAKGCNMGEILAVLAHELGHWKFSHNLKNIVITEVNLFFLFFIFGYFMSQQDMFASFGFPVSRPVIIGLIVVFELIFTPYNFLYSFCMVQLIRRFEYQADEFAQSMGKAQPLSTALIKLVQDNLGFPIADSLYSNFHHTHPTVLERVRNLKTKQD